MLALIRFSLVKFCNTVSSSRLVMFFVFGVLVFGVCVGSSTSISIETYNGLLSIAVCNCSIMSLTLLCWNCMQCTMVKFRLLL